MRRLMSLKEEEELGMGEGSSRQREQKMHRQEYMNEHESIGKL